METKDVCYDLYSNINGIKYKLLMPLFRWYLVVIVLLYVGLLTSFSLNVSLLIRQDSVPIRILSTTSNAVL